MPISDVTFVDPLGGAKQKIQVLFNYPCLLNTLYMPIKTCSLNAG